MVDVLGGEKKSKWQQGEQEGEKKKKEKKGGETEKTSVQGVKFTKTTTILYSSTVK